MLERISEGRVGVLGVDMNWINLTQNKDKWKVIVNPAVNLGVPQIATVDYSINAQVCNLSRHVSAFLKCTKLHVHPIAIAIGAPDQNDVFQPSSNLRLEQGTPTGCEFGWIPEPVWTQSKEK
jgi:hypothetical protein